MFSVSVWLWIKLKTLGSTQFLYVFWISRVSNRDALPGVLTNSGSLEFY